MKMINKTLDVWQGVAFECEEDTAQELQYQLKGFCRQSNGKIVISRLVGHLQLASGLRLRIRSSKADGAVILAWMAYCDPTFRALGSVKPLAQVGSQGEVGSVLAKTFSRLLLNVISRTGLNRRYLRKRRESLALRGRIDFAQLARRGGISALVPCEVWERHPDTPLNRLLSAAVHKIERDALWREVCSAELLALRGLFDGVPRVVPQRLLSGAEPLNRLEGEFEACAALARLLLTQGGLSEGMSAPGLGFVLDLERLFEKAVGRALQEWGLPYEQQKSLPYNREPSGSGHFSVDFFCPDINGESVVIDAKFRQKLSSSNLQQMISYCVMTGSRRAVLVVPAGEAVDPRPYTIPTSAGRLVIEVAQLEVGGKRVSEWDRHGHNLMAALHSGSERPARAVPPKQFEPSRRF